MTNQGLSIVPLNVGLQKKRVCQNNVQSPDGEKSAIKPNVQKGACSHFAIAKRIIEENPTNPSKSNKL